MSHKTAGLSRARIFSVLSCQEHILYQVLILATMACTYVLSDLATLKSEGNASIS